MGDPHSSIANGRKEPHVRTHLQPDWLVHDDNDLPVVPTVIGYRRDGTPIWLAAGGSASDISDWIPVEYDSNVIQRVQMDSAIERYGLPYPMRSSTRSIPRSAGITVSAGTSYSDDTSTADDVTITARRFIARFKVDEDDLADASTRMNVIESKGMDWAISYADTIDNACFGVSAAENGTTAPFTSAYKTLRTTDSDISYTADDNYVTWDDDLINIPSSPAGTSLYEKLSHTLGLVEGGKYWSVADMLVVASPGWRQQLRNCTDTQGRPIFTDRGGNLPGNTTPDALFGIPIAWSRGCKVSGSLSGSPTGNDLLYFANRRYLALGRRSGPETLIDTARAQDDTDDLAVKFRARRAFRTTHAKAAAVLERITD
jgi:hypothetical protein